MLMRVAEGCQNEVQQAVLTQALDATKQRLQALRKRLKRYTREE